MIYNALELVSAQVVKACINNFNIAEIFRIERVEEEEDSLK